METLYRKIEIKSKDDLPKKDGFYIASCKDYAVLEYHYCSEVKRDWLKEVDWYLQPIDQPCTCGGYPDCICDITRASVHPIEPQEPKVTFDCDHSFSLPENGYVYCANCKKLFKLEIDINTPFFGNTGANIPIQPQERYTHVCDKCMRIFEDDGPCIGIKIDILCPKCIQERVIEVKEKIKSHISNEEAVVSKLIREDNERAIGVTDEEIDLCAREYGELTEGNKNGELAFAYREGAKLVRDKLKSNG